MAPSYFTFDGHSSSSGSFVPYGDSTYDDGVDFGEDNSPQNDDPDDTVSDKKPTPKRRRVTRACDECRRKKIRCDGKQPCSHCSVFGYECTYDLPTNRRRNATPQYTEFLEGQLKSAIKLLQLVFPAMDFNTPGMLDHLRNRLQAQLSTQASQPPTMTPSLRNMGLPDMDSAESIPTTVQPQAPEKIETPLDMHEKVTWEVSNQFADLNFTNKLWSCRNMHPNCPNPTSSPPTSLEHAAEFHESRSPTMANKNSYASPTRKRRSLHHMATSTNASPGGFNVNAANNIHQSFMFPPASVGTSSPSSSVPQTQPVNTSTMIFPSSNAPVYSNHSVPMFENGEIPTKSQEKEAQFIETIPQRRHSTNTMAFPGTSTLNEIYHESARQPMGYGAQFYEAMSKTQMSDNRMQRCVPFEASNPSQPLHPISAQYSSSMDQQAWSHASLNSRMNMGNAGLAGRNG